MTVEQAHIILDQRFDKLNTDAYDDLLIQEKDLWLYEGLMSIVKSRTKPQPYWDFNFQDNKAQYDTLENLLSSVDLDLQFVDANTLVADLPNNYFMAISEEIESLVCIGTTVETEEVSKNFVVIPWPDDDRGDRVHNYYENLRIALVKNDFTLDYIYTEILFPDYASGVEEKELYYMQLYNYLENLDNVIVTGYKIYWEWFCGKFYPNSLIVENTNATPIINANWFLGGVQKGSVGAQTETYSVYDSALNKAQRYKSEARLVRTERLRNILNNSMSTTSFDSPVVSMKEHRIYVHHDSTFVPETLTLNYLRVPRHIDIRSKTFAEIDVAYHHEVINETVEQLTAAINAETHKIIKTDNIS